ncbi:MAG: YheC/YheD family protein, partial [Bacilli bacterium]
IIYIRKLVGSTPHIVQQYIALAEVGGRPIDIRVMVQRMKSRPWNITGSLAKVAGAKHIVTNVARSKGYVLPTRTALKKTFGNDKKVEKIVSSLNQTSMIAAKQLGKSYSTRKVGLDMGIDTNGKVWIIEPNFDPAFSLFLKLKDKTMYRTIVKYNRS